MASQGRDLDARTAIVDRSPATASGRRSSRPPGASSMPPARRSASRSTGPSYLVGGAAIDTYGVAIRPEDVAACGEADAILLGAVGGPKWSDPKAAVRPEQALFALRGGLGLYANLRPVTVHPALVGVLAAAARAARRRRPADRPRADRRDLLRRARPRQRPGRRPRRARHAAVHARPRSAGRPAGVRAGARRGAATSPRVDKANVLATSRLWRTVADEVAAEHPGRDGRAPARRLVRDAARPPAGRLRRHRHREPVRRHPVGRGGGAGREPGMLPSASLGERTDRARHVRPVRADPRLRARHRRAGHRPTRSARSSRRRCCCGSRSAARTRRRRSRRPSRGALDDGWRTGDLADPANQDDGLRRRSARPRSRPP